MTQRYHQHYRNLPLLSCYAMPLHCMDTDTGTLHLCPRHALQHICLADTQVCVQRRAARRYELSL